MLNVQWASLLYNRQRAGRGLNHSYGPLCPEAHSVPLSSFRAQSNGFPKERFLSIVLTRICTKSGVHKSHSLSSQMKGTDESQSNRNITVEKFTTRVSLTLSRGNFYASKKRMHKENIDGKHTT